MNNITPLEGIDLSDEIIVDLKGKSFIAVSEDCNGRIVLSQNKISIEKAVFLMTAAINDMVNGDMD